MDDLKEYLTTAWIIFYDYAEVVLVVLVVLLLIAVLAGKK